MSAEGRAEHPAESNPRKVDELSLAPGETEGENVEGIPPAKGSPLPIRDGMGTDGNQEVEALREDISTAVSTPTTDVPLLLRSVSPDSATLKSACKVAQVPPSQSSLYPEEMLTTHSVATQPMVAYSDAKACSLVSSMPMDGEHIDALFAPTSEPETMDMRTQHLGCHSGNFHEGPEHYAQQRCRASEEPIGLAPSLGTSHTAAGDNGDLFPRKSDLTPISLGALVDMGQCPSEPSAQIENDEALLRDYSVYGLLGSPTEGGRSIPLSSTDVIEMQHPIIAGGHGAPYLPAVPMQPKYYHQLLSPGMTFTSGSQGMAMKRSRQDVNGLFVDEPDGKRGRLEDQGIEPSPNKEYRPIGMVKSAKFNGVFRQKPLRRWDAVLVFDGAEHHLGTYDTEEESARAYDRALIFRWGREEAVLKGLNFPLTDYPICDKLLARDLLTAIREMKGEPETVVDTKIDSCPTKRSSPYRGVSGHKQTGKWISQVKHNRRQVYLGFYSDQEMAAHAYDQAAIKVYGRETQLNFPLSTYAHILDHIESAPLDQLVEELRTQALGKTRAPKSVNPSQFRGVVQDKSGRWRAQISVLGHGTLYLGVYDEETIAARAFDQAAICAKGKDKARTNFPTECYADQLPHLESTTIDQLAKELRAHAAVMKKQSSSKDGIGSRRRASSSKQGSKHASLGPTPQDSRPLLGPRDCNPDLITTSHDAMTNRGCDDDINDANIGPADVGNHQGRAEEVGLGPRDLGMGAGGLVAGVGDGEFEGCPRSGGELSFMAPPSLYANLPCNIAGVAPPVGPMYGVPSGPGGEHMGSQGRGPFGFGMGDAVAPQSNGEA
ncbi:unnamed protein product [Ostreobium quekettii]|uniref:AP2/ERF domain-containing protein n=1 Tax=Ostreobium quekettii TaxID=121088 RepID=A0A8S1J4W4_9CHLO|nr:unnamed protein product [Ostreobium quekettii]